MAEAKAASAAPPPAPTSNIDDLLSLGKRQILSCLVIIKHSDMVSSQPPPQPQHQNPPPEFNPWGGKRERKPFEVLNFVKRLPKPPQPKQTLSVQIHGVPQPRLPQPPRHLPSKLLTRGVHRPLQSRPHPQRNPPPTHGERPLRMIPLVLRFNRLRRQFNKHHHQHSKRRIPLVRLIHLVVVLPHSQVK